MPSRIVRDGINTSMSLSTVSIGAELLFRKLHTEADDWGLFDARAQVLKGRCFPLRGGVDCNQIEVWLAELVEDGCVLVYEDEGRPYLWLTGWEKHRGKGRRAESSRYPLPAGHPLRSEDSEDSEEVRGSPGDPPEGIGYGDEGMGTRVEPHDAPPARGTGRGRRPAARTRAPDALTAEQLEKLRAWCAEKQPAHLGQLEQLVEAALDWHRANGSLKADWIATMRTWIRKQDPPAAGNGKVYPVTALGLRALLRDERALHQLADACTSEVQATADDVRWWLCAQFPRWAGQDGKPDLMARALSWIPRAKDDEFQRASRCGNDGRYDHFLQEAHA